VGSLDKYWANIDTIQHVLLVCGVAERQMSVMESVMQAAMGGPKTRHTTATMEG
jgi:hypothetical protein